MPRGNKTYEIIDVSVVLFKGGEVTYQIVGEDEAKIKSGKLSVSAPLARSLMGKETGEISEFLMPLGNKTYEIIDVSYP